MENENKQTTLQQFPTLVELGFEKTPEKSASSSQSSDELITMKEKVPLSELKEAYNQRSFIKWLIVTLVTYAFMLAIFVTCVCGIFYNVKGIDWGYLFFILIGIIMPSPFDATKKAYKKMKEKQE